MKYNLFARLSIGISLHLYSLPWFITVSCLKLWYVSDFSDTAEVAVPDFILESNTCQSQNSKGYFLSLVF